MTEQMALNYIKLFREEWDVNSKTKNAEALDVAIKALEKDIPQSVRLYIGQDMQCPSCNNRLRNYEGVMIGYCKYCGQLLVR